MIRGASCWLLLCWVESSKWKPELFLGRILCHSENSVLDLCEVEKRFGVLERLRELLVGKKKE